jgi:hypothetical protein
MFWKKRKEEGGIQYATLNQRLFASMIDLFLLMLIWTPIETLLMKAIYKDQLMPNQEFSILFQQKAEKYIELEKPISTDLIISTFEELSKSHSIISIFFEQIITLILLVILMFIFWIKKQATPGKMFLSLKIVDNATLQPPTMSQYIIRILSYPISIIPLGMGIFYMAFNKKKRAWHDFFAGTAVIRVKKKKNDKQ